MNRGGKKTVLFIVGSGHSGSTILDLAIGAHSACFSLGEITQLHHAVKNNTHCVCGERILSCTFWREAFQDILRDAGSSIIDTPESFSLEPPRNTKRTILLKLEKLAQVLGIRRCRESWVARTACVYRDVYSRSGSSILVDSSKDIRRGLILANQLPEYEFRFLHLVRDVRAVAWSYRKQTYSVQLPDEEQPRVMPAHEVLSPAAASDAWFRGNRLILILLWLKVRAAHYTRIRYEDLSASPEDTLTGLSNWLDLAYEPGMVTYGQFEHHNVGGNSSRFNSSRIRASSASWTNNLTQTEIDTCQRVSGSLMRRFGYESHPTVGSDIH